MSRVWTDFKPSLSQELLDAVDSFAFSQATPVQAATIPQLLSHKDVVVEAVTGSGKTLAFLLPVVQILSNPKWADRCKNRSCCIGSIVLSPTRELAVQSFDILNRLLVKCPSANLKTLLLIGGVSNTLEEDFEKYCKEGGNVIVATPGRLNEFFRRFAAEVGPNIKDNFEVLIFDEADRLLDMGFETSVQSILEKIPKQRRTGLFSATMTDAVGELVRTGLRNPVKVTVKVENSSGSQDSRVPTQLQIFYHLAKDFEDKVICFISYVRDQLAQRKKIITYFATCSCVDYYSQVLHKTALDGRKVFSLHGKMPHNKRALVLKNFVEAQGDALLFCTDLAARGLDFPDVDLVIQFDPPQDPKSFSHRCGRTARSGRRGEAVVFLQEAEHPYVELLKNRGVPMNVLNADMAMGDSSIIDKLRDSSLKDRDVYEASIKAFVSYIRFYQEHHAKFIFKLKELNIASLARSFGILRLPSMPEFKTVFTKSAIDAFQTVEHDPDQISYRNSQREKQRLVSSKKRREEKAAKLEEIKLAKASQPKKRDNSVPWSEQKAKKSSRSQKKEKKAARREKLSIPKHEDFGEEDLDELNEDYKQFKREKKTKLDK